MVHMGVVKYSTIENHYFRRMIYLTLDEVSLKNLQNEIRELTAFPYESGSRSPLPAWWTVPMWTALEWQPTLTTHSRHRCFPRNHDSVEA